MANNYSSDPKNAFPINNFALPQDGTNGMNSAAPERSSGRGAFSNSERDLRPSDRHTRLQSGIELSSARYTIEKLIASGGMGAVYRAIDTRFQKPCAVKEMLDEFRNESERAQSIEWFRREADLLLELNHPGIPRVRDFFTEQGRHYLVMDFIEGRTLGEAVEQEGNVEGLNGARGVPEARTRSWAQQVCSVLAYLHSRKPQVIFRDLKPSNIMVTNQDEIKLIDFGIARNLKPGDEKQQLTVISTMGYAPPEQMLGEPEPRSDIYALGATLHKVLTRHEASNNKPNMFVFPPVRTLRPDVSLAFEQIIMKALNYVKEQRWSNAAEMERAIMVLPPVVTHPPIIVPGVQPQPLNPQTPHLPSSVPSGLSGPKTQVTMGVNGPAGPHITAALAHLAGGRIEFAYTVVQQAFAFEPNNPLVHKIFGQVFARRQPPRSDLAQNAYERSLQLYAEDAETHKLLGDVFLFLRQQPPLAIPYYTQSIKLNEKDGETHLRLGQCYERTNQLDIALRAYQEAVTQAPKHIPNHLALGYLALRINRLPIAEQAFVQVLVLNPADYQTRFVLSQVYERENRLEEAFQQCGHVVGPLSATNPAVSQMYQRLRVRLGR